MSRNIYVKPCKSKTKFFRRKKKEVQVIESPERTIYIPETKTTVFLKSGQDENEVRERYINAWKRENLHNKQLNPRKKPTK